MRRLQQGLAQRVEFVHSGRGEERSEFRPDVPQTFKSALGTQLQFGDVGAGRSGCGVPGEIVWLQGARPGDQAAHGPHQFQEFVQTDIAYRPRRLTRWIDAQHGVSRKPAGLTPYVVEDAL